MFPPPKEVNWTCSYSSSEVQDVDTTAEELSNEQLCELLDNHLHIDARPNFAAAVALASIQPKQATHPHKVMLPWQGAWSLYVGANVINFWCSMSLHPMLSVENMMHAGLTAVQLCICQQTACCSLDMVDGRGAAQATSMLTAASVSVTSFQAPCRSSRWRRMQRLHRCLSCWLPCEAMMLSHLLDLNSLLGSAQECETHCIQTALCIHRVDVCPVFSA